jgi:hypothetical protein
VSLRDDDASTIFSGQNFCRAQSQNNMYDSENALHFTTSKRVNYRKLAFKNYPALCAHCGFGIKDVLEVAHIDCNRANNDPSNLVILCPNCHKMHDLDLISTETIKEMRDRPKVVVWSKRMKDAGRKAALSRAKTIQKRKWQIAGIKAAQTRAKNKQLG